MAACPPWVRRGELRPLQCCRVGRKLRESASRGSEPDRSREAGGIAIVGIGCRFPGGLDGPDGFWRGLLDRVDAIGEIPPDRFDAAALHGRKPGGVSSVLGGYLEGIDRLDAAYFGISPREAERLDPQQRLLLEVSQEALENAGMPMDALVGSPAGVFVGLFLTDFEARLFRDPDSVDLYSTTGTGRYAASGRLSFAFGLEGPSLTLDTACSSSLVAVHLAVQSLLAGECPLAIAGGANVILQPHYSIAYSRSGMISPDGRCKFGDARGDGYVRSEGAGMVVLKRIEDAMADRDRVYAVIAGSSVTNDGRSGDHLATPAQQGQERMLRVAYEKAGISPGRVDYVEAHGTGTATGDPIEMAALSAVLSRERSPDRRCLVGSVKTNIGHTEGAAGVAGLIKSALVLHHRIVPPNLHFKVPNPRIPWAEIPLDVPRDPMPLPANGSPATAGVSSFGITGTNAHLVLTEAPAPTWSSAAPLPGQALLLALSAASEEGLMSLARSTAGALDAAGSGELGNLVYTAACRRAHLPHRLCVVESDAGRMATSLRAHADGEAALKCVHGTVQPGKCPAVVFVYPGQGSQWIGMGRRLLRENAAFRAALRECEAAMRPFVDWSLSEQLEIDEDSPACRMNDIDVIQPTLVAMDIALTAMWRSWGVEPDAVLGHSMGEVAAAHAVGALGLADAMRVICRRSRLLRRVRGSGAMAVVELAHLEAERLTEGREGRLAVAASNSPRTTVLSGDPDAIEEVLAELESGGVFARRVKVDVASHSPQVDPLRPDLLEALVSLEPRAGSVPMYSTVRVDLVPGEALDPGYWADNLRKPVLLSDTIARVLQDWPEAVFVEVSPHPILQPAIEQTLEALGQGRGALGTLRREEDGEAEVLTALAKLHVLGYPVQWDRQWPDGGTVASLPTYPWQRERHWFEPAAEGIRRHRGLQRGRAHPLLGSPLAEAHGTWIWETELSLASHPFLGDHRVRGSALLPAAAILEMAMAAAVEAFGAGTHELRAVTFEEGAVLDEDGRVLHVVLREEAPGVGTLELFGRRAAGSMPGADAWARHAAGTVVRGHAPDEGPAATAGPASPSEETGWSRTEGGRHYAGMSGRGLEYGPAFRRVAEVWYAAGETRGRLTPTDSTAPDEVGFRVHPALIDAGFQVLLATASPDGSVDSAASEAHGKGRGGARDALVPVYLESFRMPSPGATRAEWVQARRRPEAEGGAEAAVVGDVTLVSAEGRELAVARGLRFRRVPRPPDRLEDWLYELRWVPRPRADPTLRADLKAAPRPAWLILADESGVGEALAAGLETEGAVVTVLFAGAGPGNERIGARRLRVPPDRPEALERVLEELAEEGPLTGAVHLWSLDLSDSDGEEALALGTPADPVGVGALRLIQALAGDAGSEGARLWLVTRGAHRVEAEDCVAPPVQSALWGLGAVAASEHPELACTCVDLGGGPEPDAGAALLAEVRGGGTDRRVALRAGRRYAAVLHRATPRAGIPGKCEGAAAGECEGEGAGERAGGSQVTVFRAEAPSPGSLEDLRLVAEDRRPPGPGEVEIEVAATSLNFNDIMKALGIYPGIPEGAPIGLGGECAGRICATGEGVEGWKVGDEVLALAFDLQGTTLLASHVRVRAELVFRRPTRLGAPEAAALPLAFVTAGYALFDVARLARGERVLIHAASGGVGLAAVQLARRAGAEVLATAGSPEKRAFLRELGVEHVWDSRTLDFGDAIMEVTRGRGVDVVLNSLSGGGLRRSLGVLGQHGRFVELGKRDIHADTRVGLGDFRRGISFAAVDLVAIVKDRTARVGEILREVLSDLEDGRLRPLPVTVFPVGEVHDAFRFFAQARHIGKVVISVDGPVRAHPGDALRNEVVGAEGSYLVTGGLGALGLLTAEWLARHGARHLVLAGRSEPSAAARARIASLEARGTEVLVTQVDVSSADEVDALLEEVDARMPPLRGVVHAAGTLADAALLRMDVDRFGSPMVSKVRGAWNLHRSTRDRPLDFMVLYSSIAGLMGTPGQGNYAAANAFLDGLARYRLAAGLPTVSIQWGPWTTVGLAAEGDAGDRLAHRGVGGLEPGRALAALGHLLDAAAGSANGGADRAGVSASAAVAVMPFDPSTWAEAAGWRDPFLGDLESVDSVTVALGPQGRGDARSIREELGSLPPGRRQSSLLERHLREQVAAVLRLRPERVAADRPLKQLGLDSLMALELRNRLEASLGLRLSATIAWNYPTISRLVPFLASRIGLEGEPAEGTARADGAVTPGPSRDEIEAMLASELARVDELLKDGSS
ncbi:MAG: SDR family NAD(P)-dependent oxidoreductase [Gemmatimonadales bacterium]|nr:MAG: SDR family NAD(P)-dependent oxidoreductase [Gemmatimonadales bacterium]